MHSGVPVSLRDFDYFCFHTPFSKMVQKSYLAVVLEDIKAAVEGGANPISYDADLVASL